MIDIANQLLTRHSRHSVRLMNEQQSLHHSISAVVFFGIFSDYGYLNTEKFAPLSDIDVQTLIEGKENQNTLRKPKVKYSVALVTTFLVTENEN